MVEMKVLSSHEEWLKARTKIGGSDASAIMGMNPYKSNVELWKEKAYGIEPVDLSMIVMCPNEIGFNEVECHKDDKFCQKCTLNWLMAEREV